MLVSTEKNNNKTNYANNIRRVRSGVKKSLVLVPGTS